ncbi:protein IMPAIRED IN BABA-INDUCED STERILITY 1-like isoform X2 [Vigna unguiculata]|uniref:protein IMPAIRED IN BABA-INDUCED STERILITY 1-like isoform X2 n=1 Tax=Vigna unguiculata TaxID=3917 RepID=UPI001017157B|nr:protein IMPAIRED IN BABA-INDUCED STERILITY 1-like isoform X2 [Vigna unguiculata]
MGCASSRQALAGVDFTPPGLLSLQSSSRKRCNGKRRNGVVEARELDAGLEEEEKEWKKGSLRGPVSLRFVEAEQNAAGWPQWLTSVAAEAIQGWVPLKTDSFERLDKIGQGTYSNVFQAREIETGRMVALKKVRFDKLKADSIRFMAREIVILRSLDHPNIMKLDGIITSQQSNSIYLVFEYMEHDLAGLVASPDIKFTEAQIKCYMRQLLSGMEHCHHRGIMHRDIKVSNILVNNEGVLKIADFGLANTLSPSSKQPLTSRVVTLWYRPPELLMGATNYGVSVDIWSVGCVFSEFFLGKPILKGRTEVEQLHKIFKLCGSPPEEYWKKSKLPLATMFKPQTNYEASLQERCKGVPVTAVKLLETLLSIDPSKRGTASSALKSEYFSTKPYACDPSVMPKYPPSKEMDARNREEASRKKMLGKGRETVTSKRNNRRVQKVSNDHINFIKPAWKEEMQNSSQNVCTGDDGRAHVAKVKIGALHKEQPKLSCDAKFEAAQVVNGCNGNSVYSGPAHVSASSGFTWAKRRKPEASSILSDGSRSKISALDPIFVKGTYDLTKQGIEVSERKHGLNTRHQDRTLTHVLPIYQAPRFHQKSFDLADKYNSNYFMEFDFTDKLDALIVDQGQRKYGEPVKLSAPKIISSDKKDELLQRNENNMRHSLRMSTSGRGLFIL